MSATASQVLFSLSYEKSPIILTGGIATALGGALPIIALTGGLASLIPTSLNPLTQASNSLNSTFATFYVQPGGSLINNQIALYPMANQGVAANAIISQPLNLSVKMIVPVQTPVKAPVLGVNIPGTGGYSTKLATMTALQSSLSQHNNSGGLYSIATPSFLYSNCIMTGMRDVSAYGPKFTQLEWSLDFFQPLVTVQQAQQSLNGLMSKLANGTVISGTPSWSPPGLPVGNPISLLTSSLVPQSSLTQ